MCSELEEIGETLSHRASFPEDCDAYGVPLKAYYNYGGTDAADYSMALEQAIMDADASGIFNGRAYVVAPATSDTWHGLYCGDCLTLANWAARHHGDGIATARISELSQPELDVVARAGQCCDGCSESI